MSGEKGMSSRKEKLSEQNWNQKQQPTWKQEESDWGLKVRNRHRSQTRKGLQFQTFLSPLFFILIWPGHSERVMADAWPASSLHNPASPILSLIPYKALSVDGSCMESCFEEEGGYIWAHKKLCELLLMLQKRKQGTTEVRITVILYVFLMRNSANCASSKRRDDNWDIQALRSPNRETAEERKPFRGLLFTRSYSLCLYLTATLKEWSYPAAKWDYQLLH